MVSAKLEHIIKPHIMKTGLLGLAFLFTLSLVSCEKDKSMGKSGDHFEAIVLEDYFEYTIICQPEVDMIKFTGRLDEIAEKTGNQINGNDSFYMAVNLPEDLKQGGLLLKLSIREPKDNEWPGCYNFELPVILGEPVVFVTEAKKIDGQ